MRIKSNNYVKFKKKLKNELRKCIDFRNSAVARVQTFIIYMFIYLLFSDISALDVVTFLVGFSH